MAKKLSKIFSMLFICILVMMVLFSESAYAATGFVTKSNGNTYYYSSTGTLYKDKIFKTNGKYYYANENGVIQKSGWTTVNGEKYYFNKETGEALVGVQKIGQGYYVFSSSGKLYKNRYFAASDGRKFYLGKDGKAIIGVQSYTTSSGAKRTCYFNGDGTIRKKSFKTVDGKRYYFDTNGYTKSNVFFKVDSDYYYAQSDGTVAKGWTKIDGEQYCFKSNGAAYKGANKIGSYYYVFSSKGLMYADQYYTKDEKRYYLDTKGRAITGKKTYYDENDKKRIGYFYGDGTYAKDEFVTSNGYTYYFNENGYALSGGFRTIDDKRYYFDKNARVNKNGFTQIEDCIYYFSKTTGEALTGVHEIDDVYYVFSNIGKMYQNQYYKASDGRRFYLGENGESLVGFYSNGNNMFYFNGDGTIKEKELIEDNGKLYYVTTGGSLVKGVFRKVDQKYYYFDETTGEAITGVRKFLFTDNDGNSEDRCYYFDVEMEKGYRVGLQEFENNKYIFNEDTGIACSKFYTDLDGEKLYYIDSNSFKVQTKGTVTFNGLTFPVNEDGSLNISDAVVISDADTPLVKLLKSGFSQLFKPYGGTGLKNTTDMHNITSYSCTEFVSKIYYEIGYDLGASDIIDDCYSLGFAKKELENAGAGDIFFWNLDNCDSVYDQNGDLWMIDHDFDQVCDRIRQENAFGDGVFYHVHHVSINLGNGQQLDASSGHGVTVRNISKEKENFYLSSVMSVLN